MTYIPCWKFEQMEDLAYVGKDHRLGNRLFRSNQQEIDEFEQLNLIGDSEKCHLNPEWQMPQRQMSKVS